MVAAWSKHWLLLAAWLMSKAKTAIRIPNAPLLTLLLHLLCLLHLLGFFFFCREFLQLLHLFHCYLGLILLFGSVMADALPWCCKLEPSFLHTHKKNPNRPGGSINSIVKVRRTVQGTNLNERCPFPLAITLCTHF